MFYMVDKDGVERNLIENHPFFTIEEVKRATKVMAADPYHKTNLKWSEQFLFDSLSTKQQLRVAKYMSGEMNGPLLWMYILLENQSDSTRALRMLIQELEHMKLTSYPGEDVKACTRDIEIKCRRLEAAGRLPSDIGATLCNIFTKSSIEAFRIPFFNKYWELDQDPTKYGYRELIREADALYQSLVNSENWVAKGSEQETVFDAMYTRIEKLVLGQRDRGRGRGRGGRGREGRGNRGGRGQGRGGERDANTDEPKKDLSEIKCFKCQKKGHYARDCPEKANKSEQDSEHWKKVPPKKGEAHEKVVSGVTVNWCGKCTKWGNHATGDHVDGQSYMAVSVGTSSGSVNTGANTGGGSVSMLSMGGF